MQRQDRDVQPATVSGNVAGTEPTNLVHFPALDGLRAFAFFLVFLAHYYAFPWGFGGVNIFFVLSGFLITGILYDSRDRKHRVRTFYVRRTLRIFPLYYGVLLVVVATTPLFHWQWSRPWLAWPLYLGNFLRAWGHGSSNPKLMAEAYGWLYAVNGHNPTLYFGHFWSLCVEEQFYLIWPFLVFTIRSRRKLIGLCAAVVVLEPFLRAWVQSHTAPWVQDRELLYTLGIPFQLDSLLLGGFLALLWRGSARASLQRLAKVLLIAATSLLALYIVFVVVTVVPPVRFHYAYPQWRQTYGLSLIDFYGALLIVRALDPGSFTYRLFNNGPLRAIGRVTYGAYVFHDLPHSVYIYLILHMNARMGWSLTHVELEVAVLGFVCTIAIAMLSFRYFESPFLKLKDRLAPSARFERGTS